MFHRVLFVGIFVLLCCEHAFSSKENHEHGLNRNPKNPSSRRKHIGLKHCGPMKCNIICPIEVILPHQSCNGPPSYPPGQPVPLAPGLPLPASTESSTEEVSTQPPYSPAGNPPPPNNNQNGPIKSDGADFFNQVFPGNNSSQSERHHSKHHNRKHSHLKKLVLASRSGKKAYKFRQTTSSCYVSCQSPEFPGPTELHQDPGINYNPQADFGGQEPEQQEESDDDGPYVEGEDAPIEVTREPGASWKSGHSVDFEGLDDFGADGRPARESAEQAEDKKKLGKKN